jgi:predicted GH43/DUF377 family glycosyl hydrolase
MRRFEGNPMLRPVPEHHWESRMVFNAAAVYAGGRVHILYRAMGNDGVSRIGYASSSDGFHIEERSVKPIFEPANSADKSGCEDPRLTMSEDRCHMCYTALGDPVVGAYQIAITSIMTKDLVERNWNWGERLLPFPGVCNKDAALFPRRIGGRHVLLHRIDPDICLAYSDDLRRWYDIRARASPRRGSWDCWKIGVASPPLELSDSWLLIYHGVDFDKVYRLGVLQLDKERPEIVLHRSTEPILEPVEPYERSGNVSNVVFSCGAIQLDKEVLIYYGGADSVVCLATYGLDQLTRP